MITLRWVKRFGNDVVMVIAIPIVLVLAPIMWLLTPLMRRWQWRRAKRHKNRFLRNL